MAIDMQRVIEGRCIGVMGAQCAAMAIDRQRALGAFESYTSAYDLCDPKIKLKVDHTYRVADLCERIASSISDCGDAFVDIAWLCGLLHDIGRFEQVARYGTFNDAKSVSHARLSTEILFGERGIIRDFIADGFADEIMKFAIEHHADYRVPIAPSDTAEALANVLRDADKIDILKVNCDEPIESIYNVSEDDMRNSEISDSVAALFREHRTLQRSERETLADVMVSHICFAFELEYPESRRIALEQGYLDKMLSFPFENEASARKLNEMKVEMYAWLAE